MASLAEKEREREWQKTPGEMAINKDLVDVWNLVINWGVFYIIIIIIIIIIMFIIIIILLVIPSYSRYSHYRGDNFYNYLST